MTLRDPGGPEADLHNAKWLWRASLTAYKKEPGVRHDLLRWGLPERGLHYLDRAHGWVDTHGFVAVGPRDVVVAFRGTEPLVPRDWATDGAFRLVPGPLGEVHEGFLRSLDAGDRDGFLRLILGPAGDTTRIWLTGHSLGGALAVLAAAYLVERGQAARVAGVYTYGQPRVGAPGFAAAYDAALGARTLRVVNERDLVARVPPAELGYAHVGRAWHLGPAPPPATAPPPVENPRFDMLLERRLRDGLGASLGRTLGTRALFDHMRLAYHEKLWMAEAVELS